MKFLTLLISFFSLFSLQALAHTDHALGKGTFHTFYHIAFWFITVAVIFKAFSYFKAKKNHKQTS